MIQCVLESAKVGKHNRVNNSIIFETLKNSFLPSQLCFKALPQIQDPLQSAQRSSYILEKASNAEKS